MKLTPRTLLALLAFLSLPVFILAQSEKVSLEDLWLRGKYRPAFGIAGAHPMKDPALYSLLEEKGLTLYAYADGKEKEVVFSKDDLKELNVDDYTFSSDERYILLETESEPIYRHSTMAFFYVFDRQTKTLKELGAKELGKQRLAMFSPDGSKVAFIRDNNIFINDLSAAKETQVTLDGAFNQIIYGTTDWVYEEEFSFTKGMEWSPDGRYLAYYRFDESKVKEFSMTIYGDLYPEKYNYKYPKAGEDNSLVSIHVYDLLSSRSSRIDLGDNPDIYVPRIKWTPKADKLAILFMNRLQNELKIYLADVNTGTIKTVYEESNPAYIEITDNLFFLGDGSGFVISSERQGYNHIYYVKTDGSAIVQLTSGNYDIIEIKGIDEKNGRIYYIAAESSPINHDLCSIKLNGKDKKTISQKAGWWDAEFNSDYSYYFGTWSDANTPSVYAVYDRNGKEIRVIEDNSKLRKQLEEMKLPRQEFFSFTTSEGISLNAWKIVPPDFDASKKYPVLMYVYGGPNSQTVVNRYNMFDGIWFRMLAQNGYIIVSVDGRGTGARGESFRKVTYRELGKFETIDMIESAKYLGSLAYVDAARIGVFGWSYGGYMSTLCMTKGADYFKAGIAVAPVTNWRYYDNIYTERYMRTPQENPGGYDDNSPINHVKMMKGKYLLVHGTADDNVHVENSYDLVSALVAANKQFDMQFYPNRNHGIYGGYTRYHLYKKMTEFLLENL
jgi:dipeptidyl-peptidase 4